MTADEIAIWRASGTPIDKFIATRAEKLMRSIPFDASPAQKAMHAERSGVQPIQNFGLGGVYEALLTFGRTQSPGDLRAAQTRLKNASDLAAARHLTTNQVEICRQGNTNLAQFALQKSGQMTMRREMSMAHRSMLEEPNEELDAAGYLKWAMVELGKFLEDPTNIEALQHLIDGEAWVSNALRVAGATARTVGGWE
jgi:hypothetical protein